jgi:hypothetical protein
VVLFIAPVLSLTPWTRKFWHKTVYNPFDYMWRDSLVYLGYCFKPFALATFASQCCKLVSILKTDCILVLGNND